MKNSYLLMFRSLLVFLFAFICLVFLTPSANAQTCQTPGQVTGVLLTFPYCSGGQCNLGQAVCTWNALADVGKYQVTITNSSTNTQVLNQQVESTVLQQVFPVSQTATYTCSVAGVNACGTAGASSSYSLLCETNALLEPTAPPATPIPTKPPKPTPIPLKPGGVETAIIAAAGAAVLLILGALALFV